MNERETMALIIADEVYSPDRLDGHYEAADRIFAEYIKPLRAALANAQALCGEAAEVLGNLRSYVASVWYDEATASEDERDYMHAARVVLDRLKERS